MAEHVWFVPVTGGGASQHTIQSVYNEFEFEPEINVQWSFSAYPTNPSAIEACVRPGSVTNFTQATGPNPAVAPAKLISCDGKWQWRSCADDQSVTVGGQLSVGTVFANELRLSNPDTPPPTYLRWPFVDVWAKYRVSVVSRLSHIDLTINDRSGNSSSCGDNTGNTANGTWRVIHHSYGGTGTEWDGWDRENLRVVLTFLGTATRANIGDVTIDVEWFAIRLREQAL